jgi:hypothetical protein
MIPYCEKGTNAFDLMLVRLCIVCPKRTPTDDIRFHSERQIEVEEQHLMKQVKIGILALCQ